MRVAGEQQHWAASVPLLLMPFECDIRSFKQLTEAYSGPTANAVTHSWLVRQIATQLSSADSSLEHCGPECLLKQRRCTPSVGGAALSQHWRWVPETELMASELSDDCRSHDSAQPVIFDWSLSAAAVLPRDLLQRLDERLHVMGR